MQHVMWHAACDISHGRYLAFFESQLEDMDDDAFEVRVRVGVRDR